MRHLRIIFSGGGTGGHIFPAVAIASEIRQRYPDTQIRFIGALGRMEMEKVPQAGFEITGVPIAGLQRRLAVSNLKLPWLVIKSVRRALRVIGEFKPDVVVGTGGYVSAPVLFAAAMKGIPYLIQEQNSYAGITNKLLSRKAKKICVAYPGMEKFFAADKLLLTGNPVRKDILSLDGKRDEGKREFRLSDQKPVVLVIGGSGGARTINEAIIAGADRLERAGLQVIWQTGKNYFEQAKEKLGNRDGVRAWQFISRMDLAYAVADVVVSRAGAGSVSEICVTGKPSILVPSPNVAEDHQTKNAEALAGRDAAIIVKDADAKAKLADEIISLAADEGRKRMLAANAARLAVYDSTVRIADEVLKLAGR